MLTYIIKRIFIFIPTLLVISLITFFISINAPGDPVESMLNKSGGGEGQQAQKGSIEKSYQELRHQLGFDQPVFYFSLTNITYCDTLYRIPYSSHRSTLERLSHTYGVWQHVSDYYRSVKTAEAVLFGLSVNDSSVVAAAKVKEILANFYFSSEATAVNANINALEKIVHGNENFKSVDLYVSDIREKWTKMVSEKKAYKKYIPVIHVYGFNNQYHRWISKFFIGDFGTSYQDKRPVASVIKDAIGWTMNISIVSIILAYLIAIPLGVTSAVNKGTRKERIITTTLFLLYSLPGFWIATIMIIFLCGGDWLSWFPSPASPPIPDDAPLLYKMGETVYRLILPLICWTYASLAYISRQMRGGMLNVLGQDYIRTARAKGLEENKVIWKHAMRNSMLPVITLFASIFPLVISGSFVIEYIFNIPGMGKISYEALIARNYPVIFTVMMFTAILTMVGNLVADMLYAVVDPRISFSSKK